MRYIYLWLCLAIAALPVYAQKDSENLAKYSRDLDVLNQMSKEELEKLDGIVNDPFSKNILSDRAYLKLIYRDQQSIGGSIIREGRSIGVNATVEESAVTLNASTPVVARILALQANIRGGSEEKFVDVFSGGKYQNTLSLGGTVLLFCPIAWSTYSEEQRHRLHKEIRIKRYLNEGAFKKEFIAMPNANKNNWNNSLLPHDLTEWKKGKIELIDSFISKRKLLFTKGLTKDTNMVYRFYADKLTKEEESDATLQSTYKAYILAEAKLAQILPSNWAEWSRAKNSYNARKREDEFIEDSLKTHLDAYLNIRYKQDVYRNYKSSLAVYDTIQLKAPWVVRQRIWLSIKASYNATKHPLFDPNSPDKVYKRTAEESYGEYELNSNYLAIRSKSKYYLSGGIGLSDKLDFKKENQKIYQITTLEPNGAGVIEVIKQSTVYPELPKEVTFKTVQLQAAGYWTKKVGIDLSYKGSFAKEYTNKNEAYLGIFFPIKAGESTLLFMPQLKWADTKGAKPWSFGFNLSASLPGFVTSEK